MRSKTHNPTQGRTRDNGAFQLRATAPPLKLAAQLAMNQLEQGIQLAEAVQFAARYHNVTCASIENELARRGVFIPG